MLGTILSGVLGLAGASADKRAAKASQNANLDAQREFAQKGIQWRVADAKAAGIHPVYAMGANTASYTPSTAVGPSYAEMGQNFGRAVSATMPQSSKQAAVQAATDQLTLEKMGLENEFLRTQIAGSKLATLNQAGVTPPLPTANDRMLIDGQSGSGLVATSPMARQSSAPGTPSQEAGAVSEYGFVRTPGGYAPVMSKDAKDRLEEDLIGVLSWNVRNRLLPSLGFGLKPPDHKPQYRYNPFLQEYRPRMEFLGLPVY